MTVPPTGRGVPPSPPTPPDPDKVEKEAKELGNVIKDLVSKLESFVKHHSSIEDINRVKGLADTIIHVNELVGG